MGCVARSARWLILPDAGGSRRLPSSSANAVRSNSTEPTSVASLRLAL